MSATIRTSSNLRGIKGLSQKVKKRVIANVGIVDNPEIAKYAVYNEYGWVQRVTPRQAGFFRHNFGINLTPNNTLMSPPRPFLRATAGAKRKAWEETMSKSIKSVGIDNYEKAVEMTARVAQADIQETIKNNGAEGQKFPDRSDLTLQIYAQQEALTHKGNKRKISNDSGTARRQALLKTGAMLGAIGYEIQKG